jgi:hypothetical protein
MAKLMLPGMISPEKRGALLLLKMRHMSAGFVERHGKVLEG